MRPFLPIFVIVAAALPSIAQDAAVIPDLQTRVRALEREVAELRNEVVRLKTLELRMQALEKALAAAPRADGSDAYAAADGAPRVLATEPWPDLPYEDEVLVVLDVRDEGLELPGGRTSRRLTLDVASISEAAASRAERVQVLGYRHLGFAGGLPAEARKHRIVLEQIGKAEATSWREALSPETTRIDGRDLPVYKEIEVVRVPLTQTHKGGYEGRSGSTRTWRGAMYWHENNVIFLEDGDLRILGGTAARLHLRFVRDEALAAVR